VIVVEVVSAIAGLFALVYLVVAMVRPEKF